MGFTVTENKNIGEKYYKAYHKSGLPIYVIPKKHSSVFAIFGTKYGSVDSVFKTDREEDFIHVPDGVAHFLEHVLFMDENGEDAFVKYAQYGGNGNAFTSFDKTCYLFSCTDHFAENLTNLLTFVTQPYFTDKTVSKEQGIIAEEIKMYEDNAGWRVFFNMLSAMYVNNPVRLDIPGTVESVNKITPDILYRCYNTFYNLSNMALCVCGDVQPEEVERIVDTVLGDKKQDNIKIEYQTTPEPSEINQPRIEIELEVAQPMYAVGIKLPPCPQEGDILKTNAENDMIMLLLFGGASDFYNKHYQSGLINANFSASYETRRDYAFAEVSGRSNQPDQVKEAICQEITARKQNFFSQEEFDRVKKVLYTGNITMFDSVDDIGKAFLAFSFMGRDMLNYPQVVSQLSYQSVKERFINDYDTNKIVISIVNPKNTKEGAK